MSNFVNNEIEDSMEIDQNESDIEYEDNEECESDESETTDVEDDPIESNKDSYKNSINKILSWKFKYA